MKITKNNINDVFKAPIATVETMELKGYELITELFADNSRMGQEDEPALTASQFITELNKWLDIHESLYVSVTRQGQFQVYIGLFTKTGKSKVTKIANNTYDVVYSDTKHAIRLHDTDIITFDNGKIILNSGGWQTHTTKARMNQYLSGISIVQEDFDWFVIDAEGNKKEFVDGMTI
jgi:hypothetical protein